MTGLIDFSTDAGSNDVSAPPIFWQEGQLASTLNNSARELMAALARWHSDNAGGLIAVRGGGNAYSVGTAQLATSASLARSFTFAFTVDAANDGPATLSIDGVAARPLRRQGNLDLAPGDLQPGTHYRVARHPTTDVYIVVSPDIARPGRIAMFGSVGSIPPAWVACDGAERSRAAFPALFAAIGTTFGAGNGSTTFNVPNFNGRAPFGPGLSGAGGIGGAVGNTGGSETVALTGDHLPSHTHPGSTTGAGAHDHNATTAAGGEHNHGGATQNAGTHNHAASTTTDGAHPHTGTAGAATTAHTHSIPVEGVNFALGNGANLTYGVRAGAGAQFIPTTTDNPAHGHDVSIGASGGHGHTVQVENSGEHGHGIGGSGTHAHGITAVADHTHAVTVGAAGGNQAHPNMPPGLVVAFAIRA